MILWLVGAALGAFFLFGRSPNTAQTKVVGKSGRIWDLRPIVREHDAELVEVVDDQIGTMVIRFVEQNGRRFLAATAPTTLVRTAMEDLGVTGPVGNQATPNQIPPNPSPAVPVGKIRVEPGTYEANVDIGFPASLVVTSEALRSGITDKGFTGVAVTDEKPQGWALGDADYFVRATWNHPAELFDRPKAVSNFRRLG